MEAKTERDRSKNRWMESSVGASFHWTTHTTYADGTRGSYAEAVNGFDVPRFVSDLRAAGVGHVIFTLTHAEQYLAFPCRTLESILPGRTTERDLIGELTDGLSAAGIRFIAYYNHSCNGDDDIPWKKACGYDAGIGGDLDAFAGNICAIVSEIARRYGDRIAGWWFDSAYSVDGRGPHNSISCEMGDWQFPWEKLTAAARAGNPDCAVAVNSGIGCGFLYTTDQDYYAGETVKLDEKFPPAEDNGMVDHRWICIDNPMWAFVSSEPRDFSSPRFSDEEVTAFVRDNLSSHRMTTFNMEIDRSGRINPYALRQIKYINEQIK